MIFNHAVSGYCMKRHETGPQILWMER